MSHNTRPGSAGTNRNNPQTKHHVQFVYGQQNFARPAHVVEAELLTYQRRAASLEEDKRALTLANRKLDDERCRIRRHLVAATTLLQTIVHPTGSLARLGDGTGGGSEAHSLEAIKHDLKTHRRGLTQLQHQMTNLLVLVDTGMEMGLDGAGGEASAAAAAAAAQQNDAVEAAAQLAEREECIAKLEARCRHLEEVAKKAQAAATAAARQAAQAGANGPQPRDLLPHAAAPLPRSLDPYILLHSGATETQVNADGDEVSDEDAFLAANTQQLAAQLGARREIERARRTQLEELLRQLTAQAADLCDKLACEQDLNSALLRQLAAGRAGYQRQAAAAAALREENTLLQLRHSEAMDEANRSIGLLTERVEELKRQIVALDGQGLGDLIASLRQQLSEKERDIIELRLLVADSDQAVAARAALAAAAAEAERLKEELRQSREAANASNSAVAIAQAQMSALEAGKAALNEIIAARDAEISRLGIEITTIRGSRDDDVARALGDNAKRLLEAAAELEKSKAETASSKGQVTLLERQLGEAQTRQHKATTELEAAKARIEAVQREADERALDIRKLTAEAEARAKELGRLQAELDAAKQNSNGVLMFKVANGKVSYITESDQQGAAGGSRPAVNVPPMRPPPSRGGADDGGF